MLRTSGLTTRRREPQKREFFEDRDHREALDRSRGGYGTKVGVTADGRLCRILCGGIFSGHRETVFEHDGELASDSIPFAY